MGTETRGGEREREREDWLECQSVPDESEGLVVTPPDYITIRPNTVKQHRLASKHSRQYTHSSSAIKSCLLTSAVISIVLENFSSQNRSKNVWDGSQSGYEGEQSKKTVTSSQLSQLNTGTHHQPQHSQPQLQYFILVVTEEIIQQVDLILTRITGSHRLRDLLAWHV